MCRRTGDPKDGFTRLGVRSRFSLRAHPLDLFGDGDVPAISVLAAADTGADTTMIRRSVANEAGLRPISQVEVHHFAGPAHPYEYVAMLGCPCGEWRPIRLVDDCGAAHPQVIDFPELLLGRDVLQYASLELDGPTGKWALEFDFSVWPTEL